MKNKHLPPSQRLAEPPPTINDLWMMLRMIGTRFITVERHLDDIGTDLDTIKRHVDFFASLAYTPAPQIGQTPLRATLDTTKKPKKRR